MANEKIGLEIVADDKASKKIKDIDKSIEELGKESKKASESFKGTFTELNNKIQTVQVALGTFSKVFKTAFDWGEQGAAVIQTTESFDLLLQKVGAAPDLLEQLTEKSKGTISEMKLMTSTATLLAGASGELGTNLANATPELLEIAKAANKLNPSLGDTAFLYESLATGVKRASPLMIDNLGIKVKIGEANEKLAESLGKTVEQLTTEELSMALLNETLRAGREIINQVGGDTDSATDSFARMEASIENASNAVKSLLAPYMADAADAITLLLTANEQLTEAMEEHEEVVIQTSDSYQEYKEEMLRAAEAGKQISKWQADEIALFLETGQVVKAHEKELHRWLEKLGLITEQEYELARGIAAAASEDWGLQQAGLAAQKAMLAQEEATTVLKDATNNAAAAMREYSEQLLFAIASQDLTDEQALELAYAMGLVDEMTVLATEKTKLYKSWLDQKLITEEQYYELIKNVNREIENMPESKTFDLFVNIHGLDGLQTLTSMGGGGSTGGGFEMKAAGGDVRPGGSYIVGEHGIELLQMGYNGKGTITPMTNITNNYNLGVTTTQSLNTVTTGFAILQAMG